MRPEDKSKRKVAQARRTYKTKDNFLCWLKEKDARQKQVTQAEITQADCAISQALMVWADDGGTTA
jgi:hypothetical protein